MNSPFHWIRPRSGRSLSRPFSYTSRALVIGTVLSAGFLGFGAKAPIGTPLPIADVDDVYPMVRDWAHARILHIGDSQLSRGYKSTLAAFFAEAGATFQQETWVGSKAKSWVVSGRASNLMRSFRPNVVLITLGTNTLRYQKPARERSWVLALIDRTAGTECFWIGPPPLIDDLHGYNEWLKKNTAPCRYFDSRVMDFQKRSDRKFHVTSEQGAIWAERVWQFMNGN